jgi:ketosteroid isomerase-like protein
MRLPARAPLRLVAEEMHDAARLQQWFATWKSPIVSDSYDRTIVVDDDLAYAFGLQRMTGTKTDGSSSCGSAPPPASVARTAVGGSHTCTILGPSRWTVAKKRFSI